MIKQTPWQTKITTLCKKITCLHLSQPKTCNYFRGENQRIDFSVSVKFTDVTQPALPQYAEYPVIEAKFPRDFFYPFVSSTVGLIFYSIQGMYAYFKVTLHENMAIYLIHNGTLVPWKGLSRFQVWIRYQCFQFQITDYFQI